MGWVGPQGEPPTPCQRLTGATDCIRSVVDERKQSYMSLKEWLLELPGIGKVRRVHALEHATITLLSRRHSDLSMVGRSTPRGFWLYGNVEQDELLRTTNEALRRLQGGEAGSGDSPSLRHQSGSGGDADGSE